MANDTQQEQCTKWGSQNTTNKLNNGWGKSTPVIMNEATQVDNFILPITKHNEKINNNKQINMFSYKLTQGLNS